LTGLCVGNEVLIPKIKLIHKPNQDFSVSFLQLQDFSVSFLQLQFPVAVAFALAINKAQGQTLFKVSVFLPQPVFSHGQLYVALSHVKNVGGLSIGIVADPRSHHSTTNNFNLRSHHSTANVLNLDVVSCCQET
jgi:hypothetical protein